MFLIKTLNAYFCNFYKDYWDFKSKKYKEDNLELNFLNMDTEFEMYKETQYCIFLNFNSINIRNVYYPVNYNLIVLGYFLNSSRTETLVNFTLDENYYYDIKTSNFKNLDLNNLILSSSYQNTNLNLSEEELIEELNTYSVEFFSVLLKKLEIIGNKVELHYEQKKNPNLNININQKNKFKVDIYVCNSKIKEFPFWFFIKEKLDYKLKIFYNKSTNVFSKLSFKFNSSYITFINYSENFFFIPRLEITSYLNYNKFLMYKYDSLNFELDVLSGYFKHWLKTTSFFDKHFKNSIKTNSETSYLLKDSLKDFTSIKSYGWFLFQNYLLKNSFSFRNKYTLEEYDVFTSSLFLGIQSIDNYNDNDLNKIKNNLENINSWDDFSSYLNNTNYMIEYDINSAFSYAACVSSFSNVGYFSDEITIDNLDSKKGFVFVLIEDFNDVDKYYIPIKDFVSKQVYYNCHGHLYGWFLIDEVLQLKEYCKITVLRSYIFIDNKFYLKSFVEELKGIELKMNENKKMIKTILNSIYGMFNYKDKRVRVNLDSKDSNIIINKVFKKIHLKGDLKNEEKILTLIEDELVFKSKYFFISPIINANNRINLRKYIFDIKKSGGIIGLINIDSFWTNKKLTLNISDEIGKLKIKNSEKKIIFFNQNTYINFTDNYLMYNNKKITDFVKTKELLYKIKIVPDEFRGKIKIDFVNSFESIPSIKRYVTKGTLNWYSKLNDNLKTLIKLNENYSYFKNVLDYINSAEKPKKEGEMTLSEKFNKYDKVKFSIKLNLIVDEKIIKQIYFVIDLKTKNNEFEMFKIYEKFDNILYHWFENYVEDFYTIQLKILYTFNNVDSISRDLILKGFKDSND